MALANYLWKQFCNSLLQHSNTDSVDFFFTLFLCASLWFCMLIHNVFFILKGSTLLSNVFFKTTLKALHWCTVYFMDVWPDHLRLSFSPLQIFIQSCSNNNISYQSCTDALLWLFCICPESLSSQGDCRQGLQLVFSWIPIQNGTFSWLYNKVKFTH